jgi:hypothetical protein
MATIKVRGYEFNMPTIRDSFNRRAQRFANNILTSLRGIGLTEDDVLVEIEPMAIKRMPASATWYADGYRLHFSYKACTKYVENLFVVSKIIDLEVQAIQEGTKTMEEFIRDFTEEKDVEDERKAAREHLGVAAEELDLDVISKKYKLLARDAHPDMPNGDTEKFKALNRAHKILKRELE